MNITPEDTGKIGIFYLKKIWAHFCQKKTLSEPSETVDWRYIVAVFNTLGIGLEPTIQYLMSESPDFEKFENWINKNGQVSTEVIQYFNSIVSSSNGDSIGSALKNEDKVLTDADLKNWNEKGYVIIKGAISKEDCKKTVDLIYNRIDGEPNDSSTWYKQHPLKQGIMIQLFHNTILDKNRLSSKIKNAYRQLWERDDLMVSMDRVSFNPPETKEYQFPGPNLHWDVSLKKPIPFGLQGLLYLSDTKKDQGAFTVIPGFQNKIDKWLDGLEKGANPRTVSLENFEKEPIAGNAGDFIIWNQCLPHGSSPNTSSKPRIVQYINYQPIELEYQEEWI